MIHIPCTVTCDQCQTTAQATLVRETLSGWVSSVMGGAPSEQLFFPNPTTTWQSDLVGRLFCGEKCAVKYKRKAEREEAEEDADRKKRLNQEMENALARKRKEKGP